MSGADVIHRTSNLFELLLDNFAMDNGCCGQEQVVCCTATLNVDAEDKWLRNASTVQGAKSKCLSHCLDVDALAYQGESHTVHMFNESISVNQHLICKGLFGNRYYVTCTKSNLIS